MVKARYRLNFLRPETVYQFQLRAQINGVKGPWSSVFEFNTTLDTTAPGPVTNLKLTYEDGIILLTWDAPVVDENGAELTDLRNYEIEVENLEDGSKERFTNEDTRFEFTHQISRYLFDSVAGNLRFTVYAVDRANNVSEGVSIDFTARPPAPFNMLSAEPGNLSVIVKWEASSYNDNDTDVGITWYEVYRDGVLAGRTIGAETEFLDGNPGQGDHEYYAIAYNIFGLSTQSTNTVTGRPYGYWQGDLTIPGKPVSLSGLSAVQSVDGSLSRVTLTWNSPAKNSDDTEYEDPNQFKIQYSLAANGPWQTFYIADESVNGGNREHQYIISGLPSGKLHFFRVYAVDRYNNTGEYASISLTTARDTVGPEKPAPPTVAGGLLRAQVSHNLKSHTGTALAEDIKELKVYIGNIPGFSVSTETLVGSLEVLAPSFNLTPVGSFAVKSEAHRYVRVVAIDSSGNASPPSETADSSEITLIQNQHIENATITSAKIGNLDANKLTAGSAFVNTLKIRSLLEVDAAAGSIQSSNYVPSISGYRVGKEGVEINQGVISAKSLALNNSPNLIPWEYASFDNPPKWYTGGLNASGAPISAGIGKTGTAIFSMPTDKTWVGEKSLRLQSSINASISEPAIISLWRGAHNITIIELKRYVVSFYARADVDRAISFRFLWQGSPVSVSEWKGVTVKAGNSFARYSAVITSPQGAEKGALQIASFEPNTDVYIDAVQVELVNSEVDSVLLTPSSWKAPSSTVIDGGQIRTGEIVSTNYTASTGWRVGMEGNATFNNVFARGTIHADAGYLSNMTVYNTVTVGGPGSAGIIRAYNGNWSMDGQGLLTAVNANIDGTIKARSGVLDYMTAIEVIVGPDVVHGTSGLGMVYSQNFNYGNRPSKTGPISVSAGVTPTPGWVVANSGRISVSGATSYNGVSANGNYDAYFNNVLIAGTLNSSRIIASDIRGGNITGTNIYGGQFQTFSGTTGSYIRMGDASGYGNGGMMFYNGAGGNTPLRGIYYQSAARYGTWTSGIVCNGGFSTDYLDVIDYAHIGGALRVNGFVQADSFSGKINAGDISQGLLSPNVVPFLSNLRGNLDASRINNLPGQGGTVRTSTLYVDQNGSNVGILGPFSGSFYLRSQYTGVLMNQNNISIIKTNYTWADLSCRSLSENPSSRETKDNIEDIAGLDLVMAMRPVHFSYKAEYVDEPTTKYGFIAEELQEIDPDLVSGTGGDLGIFTTKIVPINTAAIQQLKRQRDTDKQEADARYEELKAIVTAIAAGLPKKGKQNLLDSIENVEDILPDVDFGGLL